jgi:nicotinamidase-related amidase
MPASIRHDPVPVREPYRATALLIVDMQIGMTWSSSGVRNNPEAEAAMASLLAEWRARGAPILHVRHISRTPGSPFWPGQPGVEFQPVLAPLDSEHVMEKNVPDAFANTGLERFVGVSTNNSVEATARSAQEVHAMALANLHGEYATVISSEEALNAL